MTLTPIDAATFQRASINEAKNSSIAGSAERAVRLQVVDIVKEGLDATPWQFHFGKRDFSLMLESGMRLGDGEALVQAAAAGLGLLQVPTYLAEHDVKRGRLVEILQRYRPAPLPISLVYPSHRHIPLRVRALADALAQRHSLARG
jgi:DNA-binding transcriptional LysR family regulator